MKKILSNLMLPAVITAILLVLISASFKADKIITTSRNQYISPVSSNNYTENTLIIDAGHGGADGGAVSITGCKESEINLQIAKKSEIFAALFGISPIMTRDSEQIDYPDTAISIHDKKVYDSNKRVDLINNTVNCVVISIHQNYFDDNSVYGAQIFYGSSPNSSDLAEYISTDMSIFARKVRAPRQIADNIYIFKKISCPAVLVECGFISNQSENSTLNDNTYQNKLAIAIITGYLEYENRLSQSVGGTLYES